MIDKIVQALDKICVQVTSRDYPSRYEEALWRLVIPHVILKIGEGLREKDVVKTCAYTKLLLELVFQLRYLLDKFGHDDEKIAAELRKRSKKSQSFSIRMVTDMKNMPGPIKKKILYTYLDVAKFVHPSYELIHVLAHGIDVNVFQEVLESIMKALDILLYLYMLTYGRSDRLCDICRELELERCAKYCSRS